MSMAFRRDDAEGVMSLRNHGLPERDDPDFDRVAARAMLEAARVEKRRSSAVVVQPSAYTNYWIASVALSF